MKGIHSGKLLRFIIESRGLLMAVGVVRTKNITETETTMAVPLVAALLKAWLVDSVECDWLLVELHLARMNLKLIAKLVRNINVKGAKVYKIESMLSRVILWSLGIMQYPVPSVLYLASYNTIYCRSYPRKTIPTIPVTHLAVFTVQTALALKGKYRAKHFSRDIMTSNMDE